MTTKLYKLTDIERDLLSSILDAHLAGMYETGDPGDTRVLSRCIAELRRGKVEQEHEAAHDLVRMMWLYPNYRVDSRGPAGCIYDALKRIAPDIAAELENEEAGDICQRRWPE